MTSWSSDTTDWRSPFNTPLECGVRSSLLLAEIFPIRIDVQRLLHYDYLLVHSGDIEGAPPSLHPATPHRSGELLMRRPLIEKGIAMMMSRSIIECEYSSKGMLYALGEWGIFFTQSLQSPYIKEMKIRAKWVSDHFMRYTDDELTDLMRQRWSEWGSEFELEALLRESVQ